MFKKALKTLLELLLKRMPELPLQTTAAFFSALKRRLAPFWKKQRMFGSLIRLCDFVIVRCNGDYFIEFELSNICNARCVFCPYPDMLRSGKKFMHMSDEVLKLSIDRFSHFRPSLISFTPTTGDTLLHPGWDACIRLALNSRHIARATLFTNAIALDQDNRQKLLRLLQEDRRMKLSEIYFSVGGLDASTYEALYRVDRFEVVVAQIGAFLQELKQSGLCTGIHIHVKLLSGSVWDAARAAEIYNPHGYAFVVFSHSPDYYSNDAYTRNAQISYYPKSQAVPARSCAYLQKTRFAADGGIWADGCVISEMPGDSSLKLGDVKDPWPVLEDRRKQIQDDWERNGNIPLPCRGCTVYRPR